MTNYNRRDFLRLTGIASASLLLPKFLRGNNTAAHEVMEKLLLQKTNGKRLVVIQLSGGNDGLNTIIPFGDDLYHSNRPGIGLKKEGVIRIDNHFSFNGSLSGLAALYDNGEAAILNSVGYPNQIGR